MSAAMRSSSEAHGSSSQATQTPQKQGTKRERSSTPPTAESGETDPTANLATAGNKRRKGDESGAESGSGLYMKQEIDFMKVLDLFNQQYEIQDRYKISRSRFELYFWKLRYAEHEDAKDHLKTIDELFARKLSALEKAITELHGSKEEEERLAGCKQLAEDLHKKWNGMFAFFLGWGCKTAYLSYLSP